MSRFARSFRSKLAEGRAGNEFMHAMYGDGKPPQVAYPERRQRTQKPADPSIPSEHQSQAAVISWWRLACKGYELPEFALLAIPNGGARDPITGSRLKQEGVRPGVPDLLLAVKKREYGGLFIEMKKPGNTPNSTQKEFIAYVNRAGYAWDVCWTSAAAISTIQHYLE